MDAHTHLIQLRTDEAHLIAQLNTILEHARFIARQNIPVIMSRPLCGNLHSRREWIAESALTNTVETLVRLAGLWAAAGD